ncbi:MAG: MarR family transcriptional regulator [Chloroflexi bacterium]|nr:MAG: MarR family transcriptional regulator [Chloroflexota bacterium]
MAMRRLAEAPKLGPEDEGLGRLLLRVVREMRTAFDRKLEDVGLTAQQAEILFRCSRAGELTPKQLTNLLSTDNAGVTRLVDRLERKGLVTRHASAADRRSVTVRLTRSGTALVPRIARLAHAQRRRLFAGLSRVEQEQMRGLLRRILDNVGPAA